MNVTSAQPAYRHRTTVSGPQPLSGRAWALLADGMKAVRWLTFEIAMAWRISKGDYPTTVIPYLCLATSVFLVERFPISELPAVYPTILGYGFLYVYAFTTVNQLVSIEEDRTNKPHRPLAAGTVSRGWMIRRAVAANIVYGAAGWLLGVPWFTLAWIVLIQLHTISALYRHWFFKNVVFITAGAVIEFAATWGIVAPHATPPWAWIGLTSLLCGVGCNVQDIRDVRGDRLARRRTMSITWGETKARIVMAAFLYAIPVIQYVALPWPHPGVGLIGLLAISAVVIWTSATRFLIMRNPRSDHWSYQIYSFWWCSVLLLQPLAITGRFV